MESTARTAPIAGASNQTVLCCTCGTELAIGPRPFMGEVLGCSRCGAQLEVVQIRPPLCEPIAKIEADEDDFVDA